MKDVIATVAKKYGVSAFDVRRDMKEAILFAMHNADADTQKFWKELSPDGREPSIEEFVSFVAKDIINMK